MTLIQSMTGMCEYLMIMYDSQFSWIALRKGNAISLKTQQTPKYDCRDRAFNSPSTVAEERETYKREAAGTNDHD